MKQTIIIIAASMFLAACSEPANETVTQESKPVKQSVAPMTAIPKRDYDMSKLIRGGQVFQQNCATCHGANAEGAMNWQKQDVNGKFPPPPLNGTGHAWHHPLSVLKYTIKNGTSMIGGNMPAFKVKLTNTQIEEVIIFLQEKWPEPLFEAWYRANERAKATIVK